MRSCCINSCCYYSCACSCCKRLRRTFILGISGCKRTAYWDEIFEDFNDLAYHGCHELYAIGSYCDYLDIEIYDFITIEEIEQELRMKAIELLLWINLEEMKVSNFKLSEFPYSSDNRILTRRGNKEYVKIHKPLFFNILTINYLSVGCRRVNNSRFCILTCQEVSNLIIIFGMSVRTVGKF